MSKRLETFLDLVGLRKMKPDDELALADINIISFLFICPNL